MAARDDGVNNIITEITIMKSGACGEYLKTNIRHHEG